MFSSNIRAAFFITLFVSFPSLCHADQPGASPAAPPAQATPNPGPDKDSTINIKVDPAVAHKEDAYNDALKSLSNDQKDKLKAMDIEYAKAVDYDLQIASRQMELKACADKDDDTKKNLHKYVSEAGVLANQLQAQQLMTRSKLEDRQKTELSFVDPKILRQHFIFTSNMLAALGTQMVALKYKQGGFAKTDCPDIEAKLDKAFSQSLYTAGKPAAPHAGNENTDKLQKAADSGDLDAMATMGLAYVGGVGVDKDPKKGLEMLTKASEKGYERAQYLLGLAYGTPELGIPTDKDKAKFWLGKSAAQGNKKAEAMLKVVDQQKPPETIDALRQRAEAGDANAEDQLGSRYWQGLGGVEKNHDEGLKWLLLAAGQGHPLAQSDLANMMFGDDHNAPEAIMWMMKAAASGVSNSQYNLANIYVEGKLLPKDEDRAIYWFKKAAAAGDSRAMRALQQLEKP